MKRSFKILFFLLSAVMLLNACDDGENPPSYIDLKGTKWTMKVTIGPTKLTVPMEFKEDGSAIISGFTASALQYGNNISWLTPDNNFYDGVLKSDSYMEGNISSNVNSLQIGLFTGTRIK